MDASELFKSLLRSEEQDSFVPTEDFEIGEDERVVIVHPKFVDMETYLGGNRKRIHAAMDIIHHLKRLKEEYRDRIFEIQVHDDLHLPPARLSQSFSGLVRVGGAWYGGEEKRGCVGDQLIALRRKGFKAAVYKRLTLEGRK
jgi:hypothetical protein